MQNKILYRHIVVICKNTKPCKKRVEPQFNMAWKVEENRPPLAGITIVDKPLTTLDTNQFQ